MTGWAFDEPRFVEEVLKPVHEGWPPEHDLFRVYLLPMDINDSGIVRTALAEVQRQLGRQHFRAFRQACDRLRTQHPAASELLTDSRRRNAHRAEVAAEAGRLTSSLRHRLNGAPGLPSSEVNALVKASDGALTRSAVRASLAASGARELDPIELPPASAPSRWPQLRNNLTRLRFSSLWDYLADTKELGGPATTGAQIATRRGKLRAARNEDSVAEITVLKLVELWLPEDGLITVLRHELIGALGREAGFGYPEVERATSNATDRLAALRLPQDPRAVAYAVWCTRWHRPADRMANWAEAYQSALLDRQLRAALEVLRGQPELPAEWQRQRDELGARLAVLDDELARAKSLERTDVEGAVAAYHKVRAELTDPAVDIAVERCRPAPVSRVDARATRSQIVVTWAPTSSSAGRISYRVVRHGPDALDEATSVLADEVAICMVTDPDPPGGVPLTYAVFSLRDGNPSADATTSASVTALPGVDQLELEGRPDAILGRWRLPSGAAGVTVSRTTAGTSAGEVIVSKTHRGGFVDHQVRPGVTYDYRVRAEYRPAGGPVAWADPVLASATCQETPVAITDLRVEFDEGDLLATWTPPARGEVEIRELRRAEPTPDRAVVPVSTAGRYGSVLRSTGVRNSGQLRGRPSTSSSQFVLLPITVLGDLAAIGVPCEVDARQTSVRGLQLDRLGATVRLTWEWPAGVAEVLVVWRASGPPQGPGDPAASRTEVTRVSYDSAGVHLSVAGGGDYWFGVCTAFPGGDGKQYGPLTSVRESMTGEARYEVRRASLLSRGKRVLTVDGADVLPDMVLVGKTGTRPMNQDDGVVLLRLSSGPAPVKGQFVLPADLRRPVHLRAFSLDAAVVLVPTHLDQLVVP
ncbi:hypothetical protein F0L68_17725 [Solihabitans fulvus]|uniref:Fibronectin type-III domain-containing protein n=1 Tax=Solihabitans fulvus TaxID=1892852 RepID=A0A5B2XES3_9PSEU|nr:hypothetical protein [Solihabitans fulvus]KAA2261292.1 hypothetical protein F0L68_17725 [Solihabitans fulvus]